MKTIAVEIRDRHTFIPALVIVLGPTIGPTFRTDPGEEYLLRRAGWHNFTNPGIILTRLDAGKGVIDPFSSGRTIDAAYSYCSEHWADLENGDVIDIEFILGESSVKKVSEREES